MHSDAILIPALLLIAMDKARVNSRVKRHLKTQAKFALKTQSYKFLEFIAERWSHTACLASCFDQWYDAVLLADVKFRLKTQAACAITTKCDIKLLESIAERWSRTTCLDFFFWQWCLLMPPFEVIATLPITVPRRIRRCWPDTDSDIEIDCD